jgi:hypothetical protein
MKEYIINNIYATCPSDIMIQLKRQELLLGKIMTTVNELATKLEAINTQLAKASQEIVAQVLALQLALADVTLTPEAEAALDNLAVVAQSLDDLNPDVV